MDKLNFEAYGKNIIVKIDRSAQKKKVFISKFIQVPPEYEYMLYNLQYGEIMSIGPETDREEIQVGRTALFHHRVESDADALLEEFENGDQLRWFPTHGANHSYQYYGTIDETGKLHPAREYIFCKRAEDNEDGYEDLELNDAVQGDMKMKVSKEKQGLLFLAKTFHKKEEDENIFQDLIITHAPPEETWLKVQDKIRIEAWAMYPLSVLGDDHLITLRQFVIVKIKE